MPRKRPQNRIDQIADAATQVFIQQGFARSKITDIASRAGVGPGTIYLYADSKEALFDLAIRRALEDPQVWDLRLPHPTPAPGMIAEHVWRCLQNASHFPRLWLAADSPAPALAQLPDELQAILQELYDWLHRYRKAVKLIESSANEWPDVAQVFYRRFWRGGIRRVADYLGRRMHEGALPEQEDELVVAHAIVELLTWGAVHRHWSPEGGGLAEEAVTAILIPMLRSAIVRPQETR